MSFDAVKNGITGIMQAQGFKLSQYKGINDVPASEHGNTFILNRVSGQNDEDTSETMASLVYDIQLWELMIFRQKSAENQSVNYDEIHRDIDVLIREIDDPANWSSYVRIQKYLNWKLEDKGTFYLMTMQIKIVDTVTY